MGNILVAINYRPLLHQLVIALVIAAGIILAKIITAGNYYEQLGSGLIFRSYEDKGLGIDNAMDGFRLKYQPLMGLYLKTFIGKSRKKLISAPSPVYYGH